MPPRHERVGSSARRAVQVCQSGQRWCRRVMGHVTAEAVLERLWYQGHPLHYLLRPLAWVFDLLTRLRRGAYRYGILRKDRLAAPVIVVGNICVGGVGKTPVVIDLVRRLQADGWKPGVVSRGYGGKARAPTPVSAQSDPALVGDEPVLIASQTRCPVAVAPRRSAAARLLLAQGVNVIVADDGLQHYALDRDIEIVVIDGQRRHGNGQLLPAGPLREKPWRLVDVDLCLVNNGQALDGEFALESQLGPAEHLCTGELRPLAQFSEVRAIAGIGQPEKFFLALEAQGLKLHRHTFSDHHVFVPQDLKLPGAEPILMTQKDAVKCQAFQEPRAWAVHYQAHIPDSAWERLRQRLPTPGSGQTSNRNTNG